MGNTHTIVAYGATAKECISSLVSQLEYEWDAKLYEEPLDSHRYFIYHNEVKHYVKFYRRVSDGPWKAVIEI